MLWRPKNLQCVHVTVSKIIHISIKKPTPYTAEKKDWITRQGKGCWVWIGGQHPCPQQGALLNSTVWFKTTEAKQLEQQGFCPIIRCDNLRLVFLLNPSSTPQIDAMQFESQNQTNTVASDPSGTGLFLYKDSDYFLETLYLILNLFPWGSIFVPFAAYDVT